MGLLFPLSSPDPGGYLLDAVHTWILARTTYAWIVRKPVYYFLLLAIGGVVLVSPIFTLFEFYREQAVVREMGVASLVLWGFLVALLTSGEVVTAELEDRTALMLLSKPISRSGFLLGKYLGMMMALSAGVLLLSILLLLTYWWNFGLDAMDSYYFVNDLLTGRETVEGYISHFLRNDAVLIGQGALLALLQVALLAGAIVCFAAFLPYPATGTAGVFVYILGNMTAYLRQAADGADSALLVWGGRLLYYLLPNLGYLNLQHAFGEGEPVRAAYLGMAVLYTGLYLSCMMTIACALFARREIR